MAAASSPSASQVYEAYRKDVQSYINAADEFRKIIERVLSASDVGGTVSARHKDPVELYNKQRKKGYSNPWIDCPDLAGARVIVPIVTDKQVVVDALKASAELEIFEIEDQRTDASPDALRYAGLHVHLRAPGVEDCRGRAIRCEVQIRTAAEDSWAQTEHKYIYKKSSKLSAETRRVFSRLLVLIELFDQELAKGVDMVKLEPSFGQFSLAQHLSAEFQSLTGLPGNSDLTLENVEHVHVAGGHTIEELRETVDKFLGSNRASLEELLDKHGPRSEGFDIDSDWITSQPEVILLLALLDDDEYQLHNALDGSDLFTFVEPLAIWSDHPGFLRA
ncbi:ppGpp synthetase/RelA/SpoT-type nucleotidyltransferase [Conyzicola lurida]|uniref:PpGpp synthetase/RelA/SpoT-type nucleotidyltransferase n=1 Tax=Conyzicola lurida TaxID=1172621 RepID=A0A841AM89_9MICO|nr:hypothetical protein [Conyzicola lurida]MBB5842851.1 ppGpp synthetase/RelA/SpoT-type nucleotidyltransferase [Conyzicola lurida]